MPTFYRLGNRTPKNFTPREKDTKGNGRGLSVQIIEPGVTPVQTINSDVLVITQAENTPTKGDPLHYSILPIPNTQENLELWASTRELIPNNDNNWENGNVSDWSHDINNAVVTNIVPKDNTDIMKDDLNEPSLHEGALLSLPKNKSDMDAVANLSKLTNQALAPHYSVLLEWLQDFNWPVAQKLAPRLAKVGLPLKDAILDILNGDDTIWKFWVVSQVVKASDVELISALQEKLEQQFNTLQASADDDVLSLTDAIADVLTKLKQHNKG